MIIRLIIGALTILILSLYIGDRSYALISDEQCKDVDIIFARGSGSELKDKEYTAFIDQIGKRTGSNVHIHTYDLGTEKYNNAKYPAVNTGDLGNGNALGAWASSGKSNDYGKSVSLGRTELEGYLQKRSAKCPNERIILGGYSQGAQVIGDANTRLTPYVSRIDFIALFGDPKLYLPEGEGIIPDACRGVNLSVYRRDIGNCHADNGVLGARKPVYISTSLAHKTGLWCNASDYICGTTKLPGEYSGHGEYARQGGAIDKAAKEIAARLQKTLPKEKAAGINANHIQAGAGTTGLDTVFVIDTTGSMGSKIEEAKEFARKQAAKIKEMKGRVALVAYKDQGDEYTAKIVSGLSEDQAAFQAGLDTLTADGGGDWEEAGLHALLTAFNGLSWKNGATKAAVVLTDAPFHNPDVVDGSTIDSVAKRSLEIDPVNVYPVIPSAIESYYTDLATKTSGQVIRDDGDTEAALTRALTKIEQRPTALLKNTEYIATPGQEVIFDASDSYVIDATITKYQWDFNGDGTFEQESTSPIAKYTYTQKLDGTMQVRLTASNGTIANASAIVKIGTYVEPTQPNAPINVTAKILSTKNGISTVKLDWKAADARADKWAVMVNGISLGHTPKTQNTIEIRDIERKEDVELSVAGVMADGTVGHRASIVIAKENIKEPTSPANIWISIAECIQKVVQPIISIFVR